MAKEYLEEGSLKRKPSKKRLAAKSERPYRKEMNVLWLLVKPEIDDTGISGITGSSTINRLRKLNPSNC